jgi:hypothetical protein
MKPIPTKIDGIQFRSKLEARWYLFMRRLQWRIEYEPQEIEGIDGWIPDFIIIGKNKKILVDVKPIYSLDEWNKNHPSYKKILESGIKNTKYELLILGASFDLGGNAFGILYEHNDLYDDYFISSETVFTRYEGRFGFLPASLGWDCRITGQYGKIYVYENNDKYKCLENTWNECGSQLQWNKNEQE